MISADSHPVAGTFSFVVGYGALVRAHSGSTSNDDPVTSAAFDVSRWISYGGVALLGGGVAAADASGRPGATSAARGASCGPAGARSASARCWNC